jgi:hypothetical protein
MSARRCPPQAWFKSPTEEAVIRKISHEEYLAKKRGQAARPPLPHTETTKTLKFVPAETTSTNKPPENRERTAVYIASPYKGDTFTNIKNAIRYCKFAVKKGCFPIAPHIWIPLFLNDDNPSERALALSFGQRLLLGCSEIWVFGDIISEGMSAEINIAEENNIPIRYFNNNCKEINRD